LSQLRVNGGDAVVLGVGVAQRLVTLERVSLPLEKLRGLGGDILICGVPETGDACGNILIGHFQSVATAARHFDFFLFLSAGPTSARAPHTKMLPLQLLLLMLVRWQAAAALAGRDRDLTRPENVPREIFKQIETTQL